MIPHPWGPQIVGFLPDQDKIVFQSRVIGRETDDRLTWITSDGRRKDYWVDRIHAGFDYVVIKLNDNGSGIWIESDGKVAASLDLITGEFRCEQEPQFSWAKFSTGKTIAEGQTTTVLNLFLPW